MNLTFSKRANFKDWSEQRNRGPDRRMGRRQPVGSVTFLKTFKANGFGWTAHSWKKSGSGGLGASPYDSDSTSPTSALKNLVAARETVYQVRAKALSFFH